MKIRAFSLLEILAAVAITSVLIAVLLPAVNSMRSSANGSRCLANLRHMVAGTHLWIGEHDGRMPDANQWEQSSGDNSLRPYLDISLDNTTKQRGVWTCPEAYRLHPKPQEGLTDNLRTYSINLYACGSQNGEVTADVKYNALTLKGVKHPTETSLFMDGDLISVDTSVRRYAHSGMAAPSNIWTPQRPYGLLAVHNKRLNVAFIDGHVESIPAELLPSSVSEGSVTKAQKHPFWGRYAE